MACYSSILEAIGRTPLVRLGRVGRDLPVELYGKVEACNPGGSSKDRLALHLCDMAEKRGLLRAGGTIVEASAGNTGVGLAMVAAVRGYRCIVVVPNGTSPDKLAVVRTLGAEIRVCTPEEDYIDVAEALAREKRAFRPDQFHNPDNPESHGLTTAREIWDDLDGRVDALVAACGTGGTLAGIGRALRERNPELRLLRVIPVGDDGGESKLEGIAPDGPPASFACPELDAEVHVRDGDARLAMARLAREEGILVGGSAGAAMAGALVQARVTGARAWPPGARVVVILPDTGRNYVGTMAR
ncbi:MAG TPA: cysteine synthase family protein [Polyangia bacterium]|nr:cysteine synthase family protein [Polyangia bacterium]HWE28315.1 cysteine synthase family protein [Polyangia bacterium]